MSAVATPPDAATHPARTPASPAGRPGRGTQGSAARWRTPAIWAAVALLVVVAVTWLALGSAADHDPLDPDNTSADGSRALRSVLQDQGVDVEVVRSQAAFLRASAGPDTTVLITAPDALSDSTAAAAAPHIGRAAALVLLAPGNQALASLALPLQATPDADDAPVASGCGDPDAARAGQISGGQTAYAPVPPTPGSTVCFRPAGAGDANATDPGGYEVVLPRSASRPAVTVVGSTDVFTNRYVARAGNAALSLGILGDTPRLLWYVPTVADIPAGDQSSLASALPRWLGPARLLGWSALLALMLWRGRRFGRLVSEPLPVVVQALETTRSRGRMYRKAADRGRAVAVLRAGSRVRIARCLGLPAAADPRAVVEAAAAAARWPVQDVQAVLLSDIATDDAALLALAGRLASLEKDLRRP